MSSLVVVGAQWGDEGKGKIVDILSGFADTIVRFQGGANAGHTLVLAAEKLITHLVPSGVLHRGKHNIIGPAVVVDPEVLLSEIKVLQEKDLLKEADSLLISHRAHVVMPYHRWLDQARETAKGDAKIGTTLRGIGPCLEDKAQRTGIRMIDLVDPSVLEAKVSARLGELNALMAHYGQKTVSAEEILPGLHELAAELKSFVADASKAVCDDLDRGKNILFEGAQGAMLDIDHGTYPFVTSSNTLAGATCTSLGFGPQRIDNIMGVSKAYTTRVGSGPFPSEILDDLGDRIRANGGEYGATTGRPRRCGWLDLVALKYALSINGCSSIALTKLDVLRGLHPIRVVVGYLLDGQPIDRPPADMNAFERLEPVYKDLEGWDEDLRDARDMEALPVQARRYIEQVEGWLQVPVVVVSVGSERSQTIMRQNPYRLARHAADLIER